MAATVSSEQLLHEKNQAWADLQRSISEAQGLLEQAERVETTRKALLSKLDAHLAHTRTLSLALSPLYRTAHVFELTEKYLRVAIAIEGLSDRVRSELALARGSFQDKKQAERHVSVAMDRATILIEMRDRLATPPVVCCANLLQLADHHVTRAVTSLRSYLHSCLLDALRDIGWPKPRYKMLEPVPLEAQTTFSALFRLLLSLQVRAMHRELEAATTTTNDAVAIAISGTSDDPDRDSATPTASTSLASSSASSLTAANNGRSNGAAASRHGIELWAMQALLHAIELRFRFHFRGDTATNRLDKPEWYFSHALTLIKDHTEFLVLTIQPLLSTEPLLSIYDAKEEFISGMVSILSTKIAADLELLMQPGNEALFCHTISEAMLFDKLLRDIHSYSKRLPGCTEAFVINAEALELWLEQETAATRARMHEVMNATDAWQAQFGRLFAEVDQFRPSRSAENIIVLLIAVAERYSLVTSPATKYMFFDRLQRMILHEYLREIRVQFIGHKGKCAELSMLANSANYIRALLTEWQDDPTFIELFEHSKALRFETAISSTVERASVLADDIKSFKLLTKDILTQIINALLYPLCRCFDHFFQVPGTINDNIYVVFELSEEWCAPLTALQEQLAVVQRALNPMSFRKLSQTLCKQLNDHCVQRCLSAAVSDNIALSHASGKRLKSNVRTMIHTIGAFVPRADNYFREIRELCMLLAIEKPEAQQLRERLYLQTESARATILAQLQPKPILSLSGREAERALQLRGDLVPPSS